METLRANGREELKRNTKRSVRNGMERLQFASHLVRRTEATADSADSADGCEAMDLDEFCDAFAGDARGKAGAW